MWSGEGEWVRKLIRYVESVNVIVHDRPDTLRLNRRPQSFSVNREVLKAFISKLDLTGADAGSVCIPKPEPVDKQVDGEKPDVEEWEPLTDVKQARGAIYLAVMPTHAHYGKRLGLRLGRQASPSNFRSQETPGPSDPAFAHYSYVKETYEEHVRLVIQQHDAQEASCRVAAMRLAEVLGVDKNTVDYLSRLVAGLHDTAKLADGWQKAIWAWQEDVHGDTRNGFLAHSKYDANDESQRSKQHKYKKPPHAVEGAFAALPILAKAVQDTGVADDLVVPVTYALASAIARHHSAFAKNVSDFTLSDTARTEVLRVACLEQGGYRLRDKPSPLEREKLIKSLATPRTGDAFLLYWYVARRLRIADQQATSMAGDS